MARGESAFPVVSNVRQLHPTPEPWGGFLPGHSAERPPEREWLVRDLIPDEEVVMLTGAPGAAKSKLLLQLQICAAFGEIQWIGRAVRQAKCLGLYLGEDDRTEQERRCWDICESYGRDISLLNDQLELNPRQLSDQWLTTKLVDKDLRWTEFGKELWLAIATEDFKLVVIDTATKALGWLARKDGDWVDRLVQMFRQKCVEHHCTVILSDHTNKSDRKGFSGVNPLLAAVRAAMNIYTPNDKHHQPIQSKRTLHEIRSSYSTWEPIRLKWEKSILVCDDAAEEEPPRGTVTLQGALGVATEKGIQFYDGTKTAWLPKKLVVWNAADKAMTMPVWLAEKHGFNLK
jgi:hypothetical protein